MLKNVYSMIKIKNQLFFKISSFNNLNFNKCFINFGCCHFSYKKEEYEQNQKDHKRSYEENNAKIINPEFNERYEGSRNNNSESDNRGSYSNRNNRDFSPNSSSRDFSFNMPSTHNREQIEVIKKIYIENDDAKNMLEAEVDEFFKTNSIKVKFSKGADPKNDILSNPLKLFEHLNIPKRLMTYIKSKFSVPTPIQSLGWPLALSGRNMVGIAETGSGKTLSFVLPMLMHINEQMALRRNDGPIGLIIAPTRELANQIYEVVQEYQPFFKFTSVCLYGGVPKSAQIRELRRGVDIIICTPGRLQDLVACGKTTLNRASFVILDEADRMLDMGFEPDIRRILKQVHPDRQILMWSATWPKEIKNLAEEFLKDFVHIKIGGGNENEGVIMNKRIEQNFIFCRAHDKEYELSDLLHKIATDYVPIKGEEFPKTIIFTNKKMNCDFLVMKYRNQFSIDSIHGDKTQNERDNVIQDFKSSRISILVGTDVAARGLDISDVKYIINYDFPKELESYVHRIGRTGRSGKTGISYSLYTSADSGGAKTLVSMLDKAGQKIPLELQDYADSMIKKKSNRSFRR